MGAPGADHAAEDAGGGAAGRGGDAPAPAARRGVLAREAVLIAAAIQFLTRMPMPDTGWEDGRLGRAARHFPTAGLVVGAICALVWWGACTALPPGPAAALAVLAGMLVTGALHEDGLSDMLDGLGGGRTRERAMEIMRDSRIGAYGAAGLTGSLLLRWSALAALAPAQGVAALVCAHAASRVAPVVLMAGCGYARDGGAASGAAGATGPGAGFAALGLAAALVFALAGAEDGVFLLLACAAGAGVVAAWGLARLGGYTGDVLGGAQQGGEIAAMLAAAALWGAA